MKTNFILADIFDILAAINYNLQQLGGGKSKKPKPYPRPGKNKDNNTKKFGKGAIPVTSIRDWVKSYSKK